jgi:phytoene synthase
VAADALYRRSERGIAELPRGCRPAIMAARLVYAEIGAQVRRHGFDSVSRRAVVSSPRKAALVVRALGALIAVPRATDRDQPALAAVQFLVDAVPRPGSGGGGVRREPVRRQTFDQKMEWAADLFARLAQHDRAPR